MPTEAQKRRRQEQLASLREPGEPGSEAAYRRGFAQAIATLRRVTNEHADTPMSIVLLIQAAEDLAQAMRHGGKAHPYYMEEVEAILLTGKPMSHRWREEEQRSC